MATRGNAIITGTARPHGLGRAMLQAFLKAGYRVCGIDAKPHEGAQALQQEKRCMLLEADVSNEEQVAKALNDFGADELHVLVNNAGMAAPFMDEQGSQQRLKRFRAYINANLIGSYIMSQACLPRMPDGSAIVHVSSIRAVMSEPDCEGYGAAKSGMLGLTHAQAATLQHRIRVNAVLPGWVATETSTGGEELRQKDHDWHLTGRMGQPDDIAQMCLFLADNEKSGFITGQHFLVDGGASVKLMYPD